MKKLFLLPIICFSLFSKAQNIEVKWGSGLDLSKNVSVNYVVGEDEEGFYTKAGIDGYAGIQRYSKETMSLEWEKQLSVPNYNGNQLRYEGILTLNKQLILLASYYNEEEQKKNAFAFPMSNEGEVGKGFKTIGEIDGIPTGKYQDKGGFSFLLSRDSTKIMVIHNLPYAKKEEEKMKAVLYDNQLNVLWEKTFSLPYLDKDVAIENYLIDNKGRLFVVFTTNKTFEKEERKEKTYPYKVDEYKILMLSDNGNTINQFNIDLGSDKWIKNMQITTDNKDKLFVAGVYYSEKDDGVAIPIKGIFSMIFPIDNPSEAKKNIHEFPRNTRAEFVGEKQAEKGKGSIHFIQSRELFVKPDGGIYFVAEESYSYSSGNVSYYMNQNMIVTSISNDNVIKWQTVVPKKHQLSTKRAEYGGYFCKEIGGSLYFVYNDNPDNHSPKFDSKKEVHRVFDVKKSLPVMAKVSADGKLVRNFLFTDKNAEVFLQPYRFASFDDNSFIIFGERKNTVAFGKVTIK